MQSDFPFQTAEKSAYIMGCNRKLTAFSSNATQNHAFHAKFVWFIAGGVGAILFGVALMLLFFSSFPERQPYEALAAWRTAWWLFAVGGVLCGVVSVILNPYKGEDA